MEQKGCQSIRIRDSKHVVKNCHDHDLSSMNWNGLRIRQVYIDNSRHLRSAIEVQSKKYTIVYALSTHKCKLTCHNNCPSHSKLCLYQNELKCGVWENTLETVNY